MYKYAKVENNGNIKIEHQEAMAVVINQENIFSQSNMTLQFNVEPDM